MHKRLTQSTMIFIALGLGILAGLMLNKTAPKSLIDFVDTNILSVIGKGFIRLIQFVVVPLVLLSVTLAISGLGGRGGRLFSKTTPCKVDFPGRTWDGH